MSGSDPMKLTPEQQAMLAEFLKDAPRTKPSDVRPHPSAASGSDERIPVYGCKAGMVLRTKRGSRIIEGDAVGILLSYMDTMSAVRAEMQAQIDHHAEQAKRPAPPPSDTPQEGTPTINRTPPGGSRPWTDAEQVRLAVCAMRDAGLSPDDLDVYQAINALVVDRDALAKFKAYVHQRLDDAGVPVDPESPHKAHGCRIGGRLDWLLAKPAPVRPLPPEVVNAPTPSPIGDAVGPRAVVPDGDALDVRARVSDAVDALVAACRRMDVPAMAMALDRYDAAKGEAVPNPPTAGLIPTPEDACRDVLAYLVQAFDAAKDWRFDWDGPVGIDISATLKRARAALAVRPAPPANPEVLRTTHGVKILPEYFAAVADGRKPFEIRKADRDYRVGDGLLLKEWTGSEFTGRALPRVITYISEFQQKPGYVVLGMRAPTRPATPEGEDALRRENAWLRGTLAAIATADVVQSDGTRLKRIALDAMEYIPTAAPPPEEIATEERAELFRVIERRVIGACLTPLGVQALADEIHARGYRKTPVRPLPPEEIPEPKPGPSGWADTMVGQNRKMRERIAELEAKLAAATAPLPPEGARS